MSAPAGGRIRRVTFPGGARHAATTQRSVLFVGVYPPLDPLQQTSLLLRTLLLRRPLVRSCRPTMRTTPRATSAKRRRWAESGLSGSALDPSVGALKEDKMDSSAPRRTAHIVATQRPTSQDQARVAHASKMTSCGTWGTDEDPPPSTYPSSSAAPSSTYPSSSATPHLQRPLPTT